MPPANSNLCTQVGSYPRTIILNRDFYEIKKMYKINPANPENLDKIVVQTK
jgi:hypothetical protein